MKLGNFEKEKILHPILEGMEKPGGLFCQRMTDSTSAREIGGVNGVSASSETPVVADAEARMAYHACLSCQDHHGGAWMPEDHFFNALEMNFQYGIYLQWLSWSFCDIKRLKKWFGAGMGVNSEREREQMKREGTEGTWFQNCSYTEN